MNSTSSHPSQFEHRMRMPDGRCLAYADYGDPKGRPVMSFHGGLSCRLDVRFAAAFCNDAGIRLISIDRPGIGLSDRQPERTLLDWPEDMAHLALMLGIERFAVLGWSAGGPYALACAYRIPQLLTNVGTVGCMAPVYGRPDTIRESGLQLDRILFPLVRRSPWLAAQFLRGTYRLSPSLLKRNLLREVVTPADREVIASLEGAEMFDFYYESLRQGPWGIVQDYRLLGQAWGFPLEEITKVVHLWQGDEDRIVPLCQARWLAGRLAAARLHVVPGQGHFLLRHCLNEVFTALTSDEISSPLTRISSPLSVS
jgi:pimeloyl-ACP methyl ester carboxylesterase